MTEFPPASRVRPPRSLKTDLTRTGVLVAVTAIWLYLTAHLVWAALERLP